MADDLERARAEVEAVHAFFVDWFSGAMPQDDRRFDEGLASRFADDLVLVQPGGKALVGSALAEGIRGAYGSNPEFRIAIRNVEVRRRLGDVLVVTYEEWQRNAKASKPADNGRLSTVLLDDSGEGMVWLHVHETWLPPDVMAAGPYDF